MAARRKSLPGTPGGAGWLALLVAFGLGLYLGGLAISLKHSEDLRSSAPGQSSTSPESALIQQERELLAATRREPQSAEHWAALGNYYYDSHRHEEAVQAYGRSLEINPDQIGVLVDNGTMQLSLDRFDLALASYDQALGLDPRFQPALLNKGVALLEAGRNEEAREAWLELLRINPSAALPNGAPLEDVINDL